MKSYVGFWGLKGQFMMKGIKYNTIKILILFLVFGLTSCATSTNNSDSAKYHQYQKMDRKKPVDVSEPEIDVFKSFLGEGTSKVEGTISYMHYEQSIACDYLNVNLKPDTEYVRAICHNQGNAHDNENPPDPEILDEITLEVKSDKSGGFIFENVKSGKWLIFSILTFEFPYENPFPFEVEQEQDPVQYVYWIIPVDVKDDQEIVIDLNQDNVTYCWHTASGARYGIKGKGLIGI